MYSYTIIIIIIIRKRPLVELEVNGRKIGFQQITIEGLHYLDPVDSKDVLPALANTTVKFQVS
jgi:hypothetical protein